MRDRTQRVRERQRGVDRELKGERENKWEGEER